MLPHGHRLKAGTIQAQLYHRENLLYKTGCLRSACLSCASVESSEVYLREKRKKKNNTHCCWKPWSKRKKWQSRTSYTFSRDHEFIYLVIFLFKPFWFCCCLRISFILRTESSICTKIFFLRWNGRCPPLQEASKFILKKCLLFWTNQNVSKIFSLNKVLRYQDC